ncbi:hypothetical protein MHEC_27950 [Mycobacterium heckeshornense]|uniref:Uncharacterized protein n=1 Tax=Mycobacterium heckeshornense TaxID=110505 RepID=A0A7R7JGX3_9MYCO|nr:hypothetical protein MHEC_13600 [Mycobacterium heckeshornense]BCO36362.1 hypothetical protein MHEC_27950 [Mycobacterium heckeshornense]
MRGDVADAGRARDAAQRRSDAVMANRPSVFDQKVIGAQPIGSMVGDPVIKEFFELWVQRDVAVVVQLADRDAQPVGGSDLHDGVDGEGQQLAAAYPGAGKQFNDQPRQRIGLAAGSAQQLGCCGVVEEPRQRLVDDGQVAGEHQCPGRRVRVAPLGDPGEKAVQVDQRVLDADPVERLAGGWPGVRAQPRLECLDVFAPEISAAGDVGVGVGQPDSESAQVQVYVSDGARSQTQRDLCEVSLRGLDELYWRRVPSGVRGLVLHRRWAQRRNLAGVEERQPQAVKNRGHVLARGGLAAAGIRGEHRHTGGVEMLVGDRAR